MRIESVLPRSLGTMVAYGFREIDLDEDLRVARALGADVVEIFPDWRTFPDPAQVRKQVADAGLRIHSAHGCWAGQTIQANRVELAHPDPATQRESRDDLKRCIDWLSAAGGKCLVVHPGGLSSSEDKVRRSAVLAEALIELADHAGGTDVTICVENMPPGVSPGSRMADLHALVAGLGQEQVALALDTGHANITARADSETLAAGSLLKTTHVHDNDGRQDTHHPPGLGTIDWDAWGKSLNQIEYDGPVMLECIRFLRRDPALLNAEFIARLRSLLDRQPRQSA